MVTCSVLFLVYIRTRWSIAHIIISHRTHTTQPKNLMPDEFYAESSTSSSSSSFGVS